MHTPPSSPSPARIVGCAALLAFPAVGRAQPGAPAPAPPAAPSVADQAAVERTLARTSTDPTFTSVVRSAAPGVQITSATDDAVAKAQVGYQMSRAPTSISVRTSLSQPLNTGASGRTDLADLDGLRDKTNVELAITGAHWAFRPDRRALDRACGDAARYFRANAPANGQDDSCDSANPALPRDLRDRIRAALRFGRPFVFGASARLGRERFEYVDASTLAARSERHPSWSAGGSAGLGFSDGTFAAVEYRYERTYQAGEEGQLCSAVTPGVASRCSSAVFGPPTRDVAQVVSARVQRYFGGSYGAMLRGNYDVQSSTTGVELPLYFLAADGGLPNGGVVLSWRSDDRRIRAAVFIGAQLRSALSKGGG